MSSNSLLYTFFSFTRSVISEWVCVWVREYVYLFGHEYRFWSEYSPTVSYILALPVWRALFLIFSFWRKTLEKMKVSLEDKMLQNIQQLIRNFPLKSPHRANVVTGGKLWWIQTSLIRLWLSICTLIGYKPMYPWLCPAPPAQVELGAVTAHTVPKYTKLLLHHLDTSLHTVIHNNNVKSYSWLGSGPVWKCFVSEEISLCLTAAT